MMKVMKTFRHLDYLGGCIFGSDFLSISDLDERLCDEGGVCYVAFVKPPHEEDPLEIFLISGELEDGLEELDLLFEIETRTGGPGAVAFDVVLCKLDSHASKNVRRYSNISSGSPTPKTKKVITKTRRK